MWRVLVVLAASDGWGLKVVSPASAGLFLQTTSWLEDMRVDTAAVRLIFLASLTGDYAGAGEIFLDFVATRFQRCA